MTVQRFGVELRAEIRGDGLRGYASVFGQYADLGSHLEAIAPTAYRSVLADPQTDVRAFWNHNPDHLLGRQASGTLQLRADSQGLEFEIAKLPNTQAGRDVRELVERGDVNGASFAFVPGDDEWSTRSGRRVRTHTSVARLIDVSPVAIPAYDGASVALRSFPTDRPGSPRSRLIVARHRARYYAKEA